MAQMRRPNGQKKQKRRAVRVSQKPTLKKPARKAAQKKGNLQKAPNMERVQGQLKDAAKKLDVSVRNAKARDDLISHVHEAIDSLLVNLLPSPDMPLTEPTKERPPQLPCCKFEGCVPEVLRPLYTLQMGIKNRIKGWELEYGLRKGSMQNHPLQEHRRVHQNQLEFLQALLEYLLRRDLESCPPDSRLVITKGWEVYTHPDEDHLHETPAAPSAVQEPVEDKPTSFVSQEQLYATFERPDDLALLQELRDECEVLEGDFLFIPRSQMGPTS